MEDWGGSFTEAVPTDFRLPATSAGDTIAEMAAAVKQSIEAATPGGFDTRQTRKKSDLDGLVKSSNSRRANFH
jgi:hypothetical protein